MPRVNTYIRTQSRNTLGYRLWKLRRDKNWTLEYVSLKADVAIGTISDLEHNNHKPNITTLMKLAKALGVSLNDLTGA